MEYKNPVVDFLLQNDYISLNIQQFKNAASRIMLLLNSKDLFTELLNLILRFPLTWTSNESRHPTFWEDYLYLACINILTHTLSLSQWKRMLFKLIDIVCKACFRHTIVYFVLLILCQTSSLPSIKIIHNVQ
jgi:hypothetical protein